MTKIFTLEKALEDIEDCVYYLETERSGLGLDFQKEFTDTCTVLASHPEMASKFKFSRDIETEVRFFPVHKYRRYIIVYTPIKNGIEIVRVLHTSRDIGVLTINE